MLNYLRIKLRAKIRSFKLKNVILRALCVLIVAIMLVSMLASCGTSDDVYVLGEHSIKADEYQYLLGMYKKKIMASMGTTEAQIGLEIDNGITLGEYLEMMHRESFDASVVSLLYSLALFDEYGLTLTEDEKSDARTTAAAVIASYGNFSEMKFNELAEDFGFSADTLYSVYEKQAKERKLAKHLYGENWEKLTEKQKDRYFENSYMHFQVIIVNTLYKELDGEYVNLTKNERENQLRIATELEELLVKKNMDFNYIFIDKNASYEELFEKYSDDTLYPGGYYMQHPTLAQMEASNTLAAATVLKDGECQVVTAKRYFDGDGEITTSDGKTEVKKGDYIEYGSAIVKRLPLEDDAYKMEENKDFFPESTFNSGAASFDFSTLLSEYQENAMFEILVSDKSKEYTFTNVLANEFDYYYFYGTSEE